MQDRARGPRYADYVRVGQGQQAVCGRWPQRTVLSLCKTKLNLRKRLGISTKSVNLDQPDSRVRFYKQIYSPSLICSFCGLDSQDLEGTRISEFEGVRVQSLAFLNDGRVLAADSHNRIKLYDFGDMADTPL